MASSRIRGVTGFGAALVVMAVWALWPVPSTGAQRGSHPRLVSVEASRCDTCHDDIIDGASVHFPAEDDCSNCHEVSISETGTEIRVFESEPDLCLICHEDVGMVPDTETQHAPVADSCLACHDPHSSDTAPLLQMQSPVLCLDCHDSADLEQPHNGYINEVADCLSCHRPHSSPHAALMISDGLHAPFADGTCDACHRPPSPERIRMAARGSRLCTACHADTLEEPPAGGSLHGALTSGRANVNACLSCHNPHMSDNRALLTEDGPDVCRACHEGIVDAAGAEHGHFPAADDCLNCHLPHRAAEEHLLDEPTPDLCQLCHEVDDPELAGAHLGAELERLDCTSCHTPHGAGNAKLLASTVHPPVLDGCDVCHEGSADELVEDGDSPLCAACHSDIVDAALSATVRHDAMEFARCADCHNPHASATEHLVIEPSGRECLMCHDDMEATADEVMHGVIEEIGCRACHEPHGGDRPMMLRRETNDLCMACHLPGSAQPDEEAGEVVLLEKFRLPAEALEGLPVLRLSADQEHGHPVVAHRVLGLPTREELSNTESDFDGEFQCLTCHNPHKGRSSGLFRDDMESSAQLCSWCHPNKNPDDQS